MMCKLNEARELLRDGCHRLVVIGKLEYVSDDRGVAPLLNLIDAGISLCGAVAADKVVGKAAAFLYILLGVDAVYAEVISVHAAKILDQYGIEYSFSDKVAGIINRRGDGPCPMERAVMRVDDPESALPEIRKTLKMLLSET